jgi:chemotaxis protein MotB
MPKFSLPESSAAAAPPPRLPQGPDHHSSGSWKVAYADFVTALMSLFIVLWLMNSGDRIKKSVAGYFRDPRGYSQRLGAGPASAGEGLRVDHENVHDIRNQIESALKSVPDFPRMSDSVKLSVTGEGLRIDLMETEQGMFFQSGSAAPTAAAENLAVLAREIGRMPNTLVIEGHTDAKPFRAASPTSGYSNWELAADRANAARRLLNANGLRMGQVVEVRGFADQWLFNGKDPYDPRNRRVSLVVKLASGATA